MIRNIRVEPLTAAAFRPFGDVIEATGDPTFLINREKCGRYHDLATLDIAAPGRLGISVFSGTPYQIPHKIELVERHPLGSQSFIPMSSDPFLVIVAGDNNGEPTTPQAFLTSPGQGVNYHRGTWHGVLTPLHHPALFAIIDRIGEGKNLQEYWFTEPYAVNTIDLAHYKENPA